MGFFRTNLLRLRNLRDYQRELGLVGAISLVRQRLTSADMLKVPVRGVPMPVYCRARGSDFAVLRQVFGHRDAIVDLDDRPRLVIDAGANVGYSSILFALQYPTASVVGIEPDQG